MFVGSVFNPLVGAERALLYRKDSRLIRRLVGSKKIGNRYFGLRWAIVQIIRKPNDTPGLYQIVLWGLYGAGTRAAIYALCHPHYRGVLNEALNNNGNVKHAFIEALWEAGNPVARVNGEKIQFPPDLF